MGTRSAVQELWYAIRTIRRTPGLATIAIFTLALGIGANTTIFSVVDAALLRPLPFPHSDRLVRIWSTRNGTPLGGPSPMDMRDFSAASHSFHGLAVYDHWRKNVSGILGSNGPEEMVIGLVPGSYFDLLGVRPILGRVFSAAEGEYGKHYVAAISERFWRSRFGADPGVLGRTLRINGETYSIVAVMPDVIPGWMDQVSAPIAIWTPFAFSDVWSEDSRGARGYLSLGRLKPGVSYEQASDELAALAGRLAAEHPADRGIGATIEPLADTRAGPIRPILETLSGAVGAVLLIACANLASLLLARNSSRHREFAVRLALGAGRWRLLRQLLLETLVLSLAGGLAGLGVSALARAALRHLAASGSLPYTSQSNALAQFLTAAPSIRVMLFTLAISILTAIVSGVAPAFRGSDISTADALREGGRGGTSGAGRQRFRRALVIVEVALSLVLVCAAGLLVQTVVRLQRRNPGFHADRLLIAHVYIPPARYPDSAAIARFCDAFARRVNGLPGVVGATVATGYPPMVGWKQMFTIDGRPASRTDDVPLARFVGADERYLRTLSISLVRGRDLAESDTAESPPVAVVNEAFVRRYFPDRNPIGQQIHPGPPPGVAAVPLEDFGGSSRPIAIVGVTRDFMNDGLALPPQPQIFALFRQLPGLNFGFKDIVVRTAANPVGMAPAIARELRSLDSDMPLGEVRSMATHMSNQTADTGFTTMLLSLFAGLGIVLAAIGVYGTIAYLVAQRTQEFGVRIALGASAADILRLVLGYGLSIGVAGVVLGLAGAMLVGRLLAPLLFGISAADPLTIGGAAVLLVLVIVTASAVPARRALRVDPVQALREL
jgi:putative ABC transport system permease protein